HHVELRTLPVRLRGLAAAIILLHHFGKRRPAVAGIRRPRRVRALVFVNAAAEGTSAADSGK
ncbi:MAG: hypothetical protein J6V65_04165, partial [Fibrobacterales bacterium]|nr:hypothetical protein [Fibrobacterales bacterium]